MFFFPDEFLFLGASHAFLLQGNPQPPKSRFCRLCKRIVGQYVVHDETVACPIVTVMMLDVLLLALV